MASAYKCDRCENYYDRHAYNEPRYCVCRANGLKAGMRLDLCPDCSQILANWMKEKTVLVCPDTEDCPEYIERLEYPADEVDDE